MIGRGVGVRAGSVSGSGPVGCRRAVHPAPG